MFCSRTFVVVASSFVIILNTATSSFVEKADMESMFMPWFPNSSAILCKLPGLFSAFILNSLVLWKLNFIHYHPTTIKLEGVLNLSEQQLAMLGKLSSTIKQDIEEKLEKAMDSEYVDFAEPLKEYMSRGGKRIRPLLTILSAKAHNKDVEQYTNVAIAIEMFHNFTLIHDDIEDDSMYRRGKPTLHITYGIPLAINLGDALYTIVWKHLLNAGLSVDELNAIVKTFEEVVVGQDIELRAIHEETFDLDYEEYYTLAGNKTGSLIALCLALPLVGKENFDKLYVAVRQLGIAFQIKDDLLNITGDFEKYKKKIGDDITEGKRTLLVLYALKNLNEDKAKELKGILLSHTKDEELIKRAISLIKESGAVEFAQSKAEELVSEYLPVVDEIIPPGEAKDEIMKIIKMFIKREA
ncbi:MAG: polyprenyl synthetase family protein [Methanobacteriota archaeon]|nr:MAG: polyprenyl synthetase family protein [Euryarchaeota archaeon]